MHCNNGKKRSALLGFAVLCAALIVAAGGGASAAPTETVLHSFTGSDGFDPRDGPIADSAGNLYGTTELGGGSNAGVVFKLSGGTETVLYSFTGGSDGSQPVAGLIADSAGNLYGTTQDGGPGGSRNGVVFKLSPGGTKTVLYSFTGGSDGSKPVAGLIADSAGNLYGTTISGGGGVTNAGVVFKLSPGGTETVLHSFCSLSSCGDGAAPQAGLIADSSGNLYGTTDRGGVSDSGTVFKLSPGGTETVLHSFTGSDGAFPLAGLIADSSGNLYGTTQVGGASGSKCGGLGCGVVFKLSPSGTETVLYSFTGGSDGANPVAGLIADSAGNLYGTTENGGASNNGVLFKLSPGGTETVLYSFCSLSSCRDGATPQAGLIADSSGILDGTTAGGGASNRGTVFELTGTGFGTLPFSAFSGKLDIDLEHKPNEDHFEFLSSFTLGSASDGINPATEAVTLKIGTFTTTIPPGSFKEIGLRIFVFHGVINGVRLEALIAPTGSSRYALVAAAQDANLTGTTNPVPVTLTIGDDSGTTSIKAEIGS